MIQKEALMVSHLHLLRSFELVKDRISVFSFNCLCVISVFCFFKAQDPKKVFIKEVLTKSVTSNISTDKP